MKLSQLTRLAADTVDRTESGDDTAAGEFRAWITANVDEVSDLLGLPDGPAFRASVADGPDHGAAFAVAVLKRCQSRDVKRGEKARRDAAKDAEANDAADLVVATSWADRDGLHLDGPAILAMARASRASLLAFTWGDDVPALVVQKRAVTALASVHHPSTWSVTVQPAHDSQGIGDGFRAVVTVGKMRLAMGSRAWTTFVKPAYDLDPAARVAVHHWAAVDGSAKLESCATVARFAEVSHVAPMPQVFPTVEDGPSSGESWPVDCAAE